jgi:hypothetical protein
VTDDVYLDSGATIGETDFEFYLIMTETGMPDMVNGILGMCRDYSTSDFESGPIFYQYLASSGALSSDVFGVYYPTDTDDQALIDFGTYDTSRMA